MNKEEITKYVKAAGGLLACFGMAIDPDDIEAIAAGFMAFYSIVTAIQGSFKRKS